MIDINMTPKLILTTELKSQRIRFPLLLLPRKGSGRTYILRRWKASFLLQLERITNMIDLKQGDCLELMKV